MSEHVGRPQEAAENCTDFGNLVRAKPWRVASPRTASEVADAVHRALREGREIVARGRGYSQSGQSCTPGGLLLDLSALAAVEIDGSTVVAGAGSTWAHVVEATLPLGLAPPVVPDFLGLTIGGVLSVGGVGGSSHRFGTAAETVLELEVVDERAEPLWCSRSSEAELFYGVLGGLGQQGVVTRARIALRHVPDMVRSTFVTCKTVDAAMTLLRAVAAESDDTLLAVKASAEVGSEPFLVHVVSASGSREPRVLAGCDRRARDERYHDYLRRIPAPARSSSTANPWVEAVLPWSRACETLSTCRRFLGKLRDISGHWIAVPIRTGSSLEIGIGALIRAPRAQLGSVLPAMDEIDSLLRAAGGRRYPSGYFPIEHRARWRGGRESVRGAFNASAILAPDLRGGKL